MRCVLISQGISFGDIQFLFDLQTDELQGKEIHGGADADEKQSHQNF